MRKNHWTNRGEKPRDPDAKDKEEKVFKEREANGITQQMLQRPQYSLWSLWLASLFLGRYKEITTEQKEMVQ